MHLGSRSAGKATATVEEYVYPRGGQVEFWWTPNPERANLHQRFFAYLDPIVTGLDAAEDVRPKWQQPRHQGPVLGVADAQQTMTGAGRLVIRHSAKS